jgi:hydroxyacylglutathione hydrolase
MSRKLWHSLHDKVLPLGDGVIIYPGHGAGSVCGGAIGSRDFSTLGYERDNNIWLEMDEEEFVKNKVAQNLTRAPYFKRCEKLNTDGPQLIADLDPLQMLNLDSFEKKAADENIMILDTRDASRFVTEHIPQSISMELDSMGLYAGWVLSPENEYLFALDSTEDLDEAAGMLYRVGVDTARGFLNGGFQAWKDAGKKTVSLPVYSTEKVQSGLSSGDLQLLDVRQPHETHGDSIQGSKFSPLTSIFTDMSKMNSDVPIAAICPSGIRSTTGASILQHAGFKLAGITEIGLKEWKRKGYPITSE